MIRIPAGSQFMFLAKLAGFSLRRVMKFVVLRLPFVKLRQSANLFPDAPAVRNPLAHGFAQKVEIG
jgi:hypothetical protein